MRPLNCTVSVHGLVTARELREIEHLRPPSNRHGCHHSTRHRAEPHPPPPVLPEARAGRARPACRGSKLSRPAPDRRGAGLGGAAADVAGSQGGRLTLRWLPCFVARSGSGHLPVGGEASKGGIRTLVGAVLWVRANHWWRETTELLAATSSPCLHRLDLFALVTKATTGPPPSCRRG